MCSYARVEPVRLWLRKTVHEARVPLAGALGRGEVEHGRAEERRDAGRELQRADRVRLLARVGDGALEHVALLHRLPADISNVDTSLWNDRPAPCRGSVVRSSAYTSISGDAVQFPLKRVGCPYSKSGCCNTEETPTPAERKAAVCRYCTSEDTMRSASRWKTVKAPLDLAGANTKLPPPLRTVTYCPLHWRPWLAAAHRVLPTRVILSHIAHNAKPIFSNDKGRTADELGYDAPARNRKRRRGVARAQEEEGE